MGIQKALPHPHVGWATFTVFRYLIDKSLIPVPVAFISLLYSLSHPHSPPAISNKAPGLLFFLLRSQRAELGFSMVWMAGRHRLEVTSDITNAPCTPPDHGGKLGCGFMTLLESSSDIIGLGGA